MQDPLIETILKQHPQHFENLLKQNDQLQIIYTQIDRKQNNKPVLTHHYFNIDAARYFYPASTVKMPAAFLALHKINELNVPGLDKNSTMITEAEYPGHTAVYKDSSSENGRPTIAHYIKKIFLVSDNDAYNRLYEFLGQKYLNHTLQKMGYDSIQIIHRLEVSMNEEQHRYTNPVKFYDSGSNIVYQQPLVKSDLVYQPRNTFLGKGFYRGEQLINEPFDFSKKNRVILQDLHSLLQSVIFPSSVAKQQRFNLSKDDYSFLYRYMSMKPKESHFPKYDSTYTDAYVKFLMFGGSGAITDPSIRIFNKPGDAYGFLTDVAYIVDFKNGIEFMLSAVIHCNSDGIYNDNRYDYEMIGFPFMKHLGEAIYQYELTRTKKYQPDLSAFQINYER